MLAWKKEKGIEREREREREKERKIESKRERERKKERERKQDIKFGANIVNQYKGQSKKSWVAEAQRETKWEGSGFESWNLHCFLYAIAPLLWVAFNLTV